MQKEIEYRENGYGMRNKRKRFSFHFQITSQEHLESLSNGCTLSSMIHYEDTDHDGKLSINEFYVAFSKLYSKFIMIILIKLNNFFILW